jgi:hypothetical protein
MYQAHTHTTSATHKIPHSECYTVIVQSNTIRINKDRLPYMHSPWQTPATLRPRTLLPHVSTRYTRYLPLFVGVCHSSPILCKQPIFYSRRREIIPPTFVHITVLQKEPRTTAYWEPHCTIWDSCRIAPRGPPSTAPYPCSSLPQHNHQYCNILEPTPRQLVFY